MISHIHIKDFAIVSELQIDLTSGLTVLTGETGAGKSLWVDAAAIVLGERADTSMIREGAKRSEISLCFDLKNIPAARDWLLAHEFQTDDNDCILRRIISREGRSRSSINGHPVPQSQMRELSQLLVNIHGQHQHQALLKPEQQAALLDQYAGHDQLLRECKTLSKSWQQLAKQIDALQQTENQQQHIEFLNYQLQELYALQLQAGEWEQLSEQHKKLHHAQDIIGNAQAALQTITGDNDTASSLLYFAQNKLQDCAKYDAQFAPLADMLDSAQIQISEVSHEIETFLNDFDCDVESLATAETRLSALHDAARKHQCKPEALIDKQNQLETELAGLQNKDKQIAAYQAQQQALYQDYHQTAATLSKSRQKVAAKLDKMIIKLMQELGMATGQFKIALEPIDTQKPLENGSEKIQFMVCTNPGNPMQPLQKVVSGGELSRISLAIQVLTAQQDNIPTLIFDEVDVGIGGQTAAIVGKLLRQLGEFTQVLCITHQPQVAGCAHHHYQVKKASTKKSTNTQVQELSREERINEIARMVGGVDITDAALKHAEGLLFT